MKVYAIKSEVKGLFYSDGGYWGKIPRLYSYTHFVRRSLHEGYALRDINLDLRVIEYDLVLNNIKTAKEFLEEK